MTIGTDRLDSMLAGTFRRSPCGESMLLPLVVEYRSGYVKCIHRVDRRFLNSNGTVFGGYLSALLDDVGGHAAMTVIPDDKTFSTAELSVSYFRPCPSDSPLDIEGHLVNQSRRSYHIEVTMRREDGKLVAKAHSVQAISVRTP
jgi:uncharacterized protein (TIGR00369 family)